MFLLLVMVRLNTSGVRQCAGAPFFGDNSASASYAGVNVRAGLPHVRSSVPHLFPPQAEKNVLAPFRRRQIFMGVPLRHVGVFLFLGSASPYEGYYFCLASSYQYIVVFLCAKNEPDAGLLREGKRSVQDAHSQYTQKLRTHIASFFFSWGPVSPYEG